MQSLSQTETSHGTSANNSLFNRAFLSASFVYYLLDVLFIYFRICNVPDVQPEDSRGDDDSCGHGELPHVLWGQAEGDAIKK